MGGQFNDNQFNDGQFNDDRFNDDRFNAAEAQAGRRRTTRGRAALEQARLIMLVMVNVAQLWILAATLEAELAGSYQEIWPLVIASGVCWLISLTIILWWRPASRHYTSTGYVREKQR